MTGDRVAYADHPVTGDRVAVSYRNQPPKWIFFGDLGDGMRPVASTPGETTCVTSIHVHTGLIDVTPVPAYTIDEETEPQ